jgi:hypothetical protein
MKDVVPSGFKSFSGSRRMTPSVAVVTVQSAGTLTVAPDGSVNARSARGVSEDAMAAAVSDGPCDATIPDGDPAHPDSIVTERSSQALSATCGRRTPVFS